MRRCIVVVFVNVVVVVVVVVVVQNVVEYGKTIFKRNSARVKSILIVIVVFAFALAFTPALAFDLWSVP